MERPDNKGDKNISISIVKEIIRDIYGRYGLEQFFRGLDPESQVDVYEKWIEIVSKKLNEEGIIKEKYQPLQVEAMSFAEIINRTQYPKTKSTCLSKHEKSFTRPE